MFKRNIVLIKFMAINKDIKHKHVDNDVDNYIDNYVDNYVDNIEHFNFENTIIDNHYNTIPTFDEFIRALCILCAVFPNN